MSLRVLHICARFSVPSETFVYAMLQAQRAAGLDVHVATLDVVEREERPFPNVHHLPIRPVWHPARVVRRIGVWTGRYHPETYTWPDLRVKLEERMERLQPDVLHAHFGPMGVFSAPVSEQTSCPLVTSFYGHDASQRAEDPYWRERYERLWTTGDLFLALSSEMRERLVSLGAPSSDVEVVHLGRDLDDYPFTPPAAPVRQFVCVARMTEKKGHLDLLQAFAHVRSQVPDVRLTLVGDGPCRARIQEAVAAHQLQDVVEWVGWQSSDAVRAFLSEADAFVLCSKTAPGGDREGTPTVLVEAQAAGLPVISTRHAGIPEMIPPENDRFLAPEGDPEAIADRILALCQSSDAELAQIARAGQRMVEESFNVKREAKRLIRHYRTLCSRNT